jgi:hypothetical protein
MNRIELKEHIEINAMWNLVMEGKFQSCISRPELIGNPHVNELIDQVLKIYSKEFSEDENLDIQNIYIEETFYKNFIEKVLMHIELTEFIKISDKIQLIKDIAYPYKVKDETIDSLIKLKERGSLCSNLEYDFDSPQIGEFKLRATVSAPWQHKSKEEPVVDYNITISGKATDSFIEDFKLDIIRKIEA